jgi:hypothetical protein
LRLSVVSVSVIANHEGEVCLAVCLSVCLAVCLSARPGIPSPLQRILSTFPAKFRESETLLLLISL